jgi:hypothetical protein
MKTGITRTACPLEPCRMTHSPPLVTADFGLDQRLQPNVDQHLHLLATAR